MQSGKDLEVGMGDAINRGSHMSAASSSPLSQRSPLPPLGIYLHWPFCVAICPYCDFNVHLARDITQNAAETDWLNAYAAELTYAHGLRPEGPVETVFFGGGTPSLMPASLVGAILQKIDQLWGLAADAEISLEANPNSAAKPHMQDLRAAGVTRLSLGAQAFDDAALKKLGRTHNAADAQKAFGDAQAVFARASFDLIYARPGQSLAEWHSELSKALALGPQHMSLYQLTIEPETPYARLQAAGKLIVPYEDVAADMYEVTQDLCAAAGLPAYEISNHAAPGHACRHNMASWQGGDYIGIGPGAHGRLTPTQSHSQIDTQKAGNTRLATQARRVPQDWLTHVACDTHGWQEVKNLSVDEARMEAVMLGLRLVSGVSLDALGARGVILDTAKIDAARQDGLLANDPMHLQASPQGRLLLDTLIARLLLD